MRAVVLVGITGCNWVLGLAPTAETTPTTTPPLIVPPDGPTSCPPPPDFSTWSFAPHEIAGFTQTIETPSFLTADRVIFASQHHLYESGLDGGATAITSLDLPDASSLFVPSPAPGGDVFWFVRDGGTQAGIYYAVRDGSDWVAHRADLGFADVAVQLGATGFYQGTIRMPVQHADSTPTLTEIASTDGTTWTLLGELIDAGDGPTFSDDGCLLLYYLGDSSGPKLAVAARRDDGTFGPATLVPQAGTFVTAAAIDPTHRRIWTLDHQQLIEGLAP